MVPEDCPRTQHGKLSPPDHSVRAALVQLPCVSASSTPDFSWCNHSKLGSVHISFPEGACPEWPLTSIKTETVSKLCISSPRLNKNMVNMSKKTTLKDVFLTFSLPSGFQGRELISKPSRLENPTQRRYTWCPLSLAPVSGVQWGAWQTNSIAAAIPKEQRYDQDLSVHVVIHTFVLLDKAIWGHASLFWDILDTSGWICRQRAHLADAGARLGKEQRADKESLLKYFLAVANKVRLMFHCIWKENSRAK